MKPRGCGLKEIRWKLDIESDRSITFYSEPSFLSRRQQERDKMKKIQYHDIVCNGLWGTRRSKTKLERKVATHFGKVERNDPTHFLDSERKYAMTTYWNRLDRRERLEHSLGPGFGLSGNSRRERSIRKIPKGDRRRTPPRRPISGADATRASSYASDVIALSRAPRHRISRAVRLHGKRAAGEGGGPRFSENFQTGWCSLSYAWRIGHSSPLLSHTIWSMVLQFQRPNRLNSSASFHLAVVTRSSSSTQIHNTRSVLRRAGGVPSTPEEQQQQQRPFFAPSAVAPATAERHTCLSVLCSINSRDNNCITANLFPHFRSPRKKKQFLHLF